MLGQAILFMRWQILYKRVFWTISRFQLHKSKRTHNALDTFHCCPPWLSILPTLRNKHRVKLNFFIIHIVYASQAALRANQLICVKDRLISTLDLLPTAQNLVGKAETMNMQFHILARCFHQLLDGPSVSRISNLSKYRNSLKCQQPHDCLPRLQQNISVFPDWNLASTESPFRAMALQSCRHAKIKTTFAQRQRYCTGRHSQYVLRTILRVMH